MQERIGGAEKVREKRKKLLESEANICKKISTLFLSFKRYKFGCGTNQTDVQISEKKETVPASNLINERN